MNKVRVYEVAKELGLAHRDIVQKIASLGIQVRNHMSALEPSDVDRVKRAFEKEKTTNMVEERIRPTVVRRRTVGTAAPATNGNVPDHATPASDLPPPVMEAVEQDRSAAKRPSSVVPRRSPVPKAPASEPPVVVRSGNVSSVPVTIARSSSVVPESTASSHVAPVSRPAPQQSSVPAAAMDHDERSNGSMDSTMAQDANASSDPPPASVRFAHANLPPGVVARGTTVAPGVAPLSDTARSRIISEHAARQPERPRRRELVRAAIGPTGRPQGRPGKKKLAVGKKGKATEITVPSAQKRVIRIEDQIQLQTLAQRMASKATDVLMKLMQLGMSNVHINSTLDADTAKILANEFGWEVENVARTDDEIVVAARGEFEDTEKDREPRPPIVTVMGHVDHGKTSLLDKIRHTNVAGGEAGGITQHIGAYRVETQKGPVVFLDTPGHEAFTAMRARGAQATDVVILVVAADDGVMPQTKEAINHAKAAGVPIVVAINKIDKPGARPDQIKTACASEGLQPEDWGGDTMFVEVSAMTGKGIDQLLDAVLLQSEMLELRANPTIPAEGVVLEAYLDRGRGPVANVLVRNGTLRPGDQVVAGSAWGRVRAIADDRGKQLRAAGPGTPVEVLGLSEMPSAGDVFYAVTDQKKGQELAEARKKTHAPKPVTLSGGARGLDQLYALMQSGEVQELKLVIKADVQGSIEAIEKALTDLSTDKVKVNVIHTGVGGITENDVMLASASNAVVVGFNVRPAGQASAIAKTENVDIRMYTIIYEAVDEVKKAMAGLLAPTLVEKELGKAEVRNVFHIPKAGAVAGSFVLEGKLARSGKVRVIRDSAQVWQGQINSLRRFKDDVREVAAGYECGIRLEGFNDVKEKDIIECYELEEVAPTLN